MSNATELLESYGVSFSQGREFIYSSLNNPQLIYDTALQYGLTFSMLAELYGQGATEAQVVGFFNGQGFSTLAASLQGIDPSGLNAQSNTIADVADLASTDTSYVDSLLSGESWMENEVTFSFPDSMPTSYSVDGVLTDGWRTLSLDERSSFLDVALSQNQYIDTDLLLLSGSGDVQVSAISQNEEGVEAFAYYPGLGYYGDIFLNRDSPTLNSQYYDVGEYGISVMGHELGHAMGLDHPHEGVLLDIDYDNSGYTLMTYNDIGYVRITAVPDDYSFSLDYINAFRAELGIIDVAALQAMYGADMDTNTGDTVYVYDEEERAFESASGYYHTIWDAGGNDTLDLSSAQYDSSLDLNDYTLSSVSERTSYEEAVDVAQEAGLGLASDIAFIQEWIEELGQEAFLNHNNLGIAYGVVIENVITGVGDDSVTDNEVDNQIYTGAGNDMIYLGAGGYDYVDGGQGTDTVVLNVNSADVERFVDNDGYHLLADDFAATLVGIETVQYLDISESIV